MRAIKPPLDYRITFYCFPFDFSSLLLVWRPSPPDLPASLTTAAELRTDGSKRNDTYMEITLIPLFSILPSLIIKHKTSTCSQDIMEERTNVSLKNNDEEYLLKTLETSAASSEHFPVKAHCKTGDG